MLEAAFVRSPHAHARIRGIDTGKARAHPNVQAVFTLADFAPLLSSERLPLGFRAADLPPDITPFVLARDEVAFAGEAVAVVVARNRYVAEDGAGLVHVDYDPLPAVSDCRAALTPGSPLRPRGRGCGCPPSCRLRAAAGSLRLPRRAHAGLAARAQREQEQSSDRV